MTPGTLNRQIARECFSRELIIELCGGAGRNVLKLLPPLTISDAELDEGLRIITHSIEARVARPAATTGA